MTDMTQTKDSPALRTTATTRTERHGTSMGADLILLNLFAYLFIGALALAAVLPFLVMISSSLQSEESVLRYGYSLFPREFRPDAYRFVFANPTKILRSYGVTLFVTAGGTLISLFFTSMTAYVLSRHDVRYRNALSFFLFFTTLFNGGLVPYYLLIANTLHLKNSYAVLLLSGMFSVMYIFIIRTYITGSIPDSLSESAKLDGANDFLIFLRVILPLLKPALASIGLFIALGYWNDWFTSTLFITKSDMFPLQYLLYKMLTYAKYAQQLAAKNGAVTGQNIPQETITLAMTVVATGPIVLAYPFVQKHFVAGMTIGAVKG